MTASRQHYEKDDDEEKEEDEEEAVEEDDDVLVMLATTRTAPHCARPEVYGTICSKTSIWAHVRNRALIINENRVLGYIIP